MQTNYQNKDNKDGWRQQQIIPKITWIEDDDDDETEWRTNHVNKNDRKDKIEIDLVDIFVFFHLLGGVH